MKTDSFSKQKELKDDPKIKPPSLNSYNFDSAQGK